MNFREKAMTEGHRFFVSSEFVKGLRAKGILRFLFERLSKLDFSSDDYRDSSKNPCAFSSCIPYRALPPTS